jgi:hypothetical protein
MIGDRFPTLEEMGIYITSIKIVFDDPERDCLHEWSAERPHRCMYRKDHRGDHVCLCWARESQDRG